MNMSCATGAKQRDESEAIIRARQGRTMTMQRKRFARNGMSSASGQAGKASPVGRGLFFVVRRA